MATATQRPPQTWGYMPVASSKSTASSSSSSNALLPPVGGDQRFMSPSVLTGLAEYLRFDNDKTMYSRLARPRSVMPARKQVKLLNPVDAPPPLVINPPSLHLRCDTTSAFMRTLPESRSSPALFNASVSKLDLPLQASTYRGLASRRSPRLGDELASRSRASLEESMMTTSSIPSRQSLREFSRIQASRRGRGLMISGGAPLHPEVAWSLRLLQVKRATLSCAIFEFLSAASRHHPQVDAMKRYNTEPS